MNWGVDFTVLDLETTGLDPRRGHRIIEIGAVRWGPKGEQIFASLVDPQRPIPPAARTIHGISDDMVSGASTIDKVLPRFLEFLGDSVVVAHNAPFDLRFLAYALEECGSRPPANPVLDSVRLARRLFPHLDGYSLSFLRRVFDLDIEEEHRALADAKATASVFRRCLARAHQEGIRSVEGLVECQGGPIGFPEPRRAQEPPFSYASFKVLVEAMEEGREVTISYRNHGHGCGSTRIVPRRFVSCGGFVYMIARLAARGEDRTYRLDRITAVR